MAHLAMLVYQRVNLHFPIVFLWFSHGFPMKTSIFRAETEDLCRSTCSSAWSDLDLAAKDEKILRPRVGPQSSEGVKDLKKVAEFYGLW